MKNKYQNKLEKTISFFTQANPTVLRKKFKKSESQRIYFFFLCGGDLNTYPNRNLLKNYLDKQSGCYPIIVENIFLKYKDQNLLDLEDLLSYISDVIVIFPESFGSVCELGAFANSECLRKKVFVFQDSKFKNESSFIKLGPIQSILDVNSDSVYWLNNTNASKRQAMFKDSDTKALLECKIIQNEKNKEEITWFTKEDNESITITDLSYYFLALIDLVSFFYSLPRSIIADVFLRIMNVKECKVFGPYEVRNKNIDFHRLTDFFIETGIQCNLFLEEGKFIKLKEPIKQIDGELYHVGNVLFPASFTKSRTFNSIRTDFLAQARKKR